MNGPDQDVLYGRRRGGSDIRLVNAVLAYTVRFYNFVYGRTAVAGRCNAGACATRSPAHAWPLKSAA